MTVAEIIAIYERLSPENQTQLREFVQTLISARKDAGDEGGISSAILPQPIEKPVDQDYLLS